MAAVLGTLLANCTILSWLWSDMTNSALISLKRNILVVPKPVHLGIPILSLVPSTQMLPYFFRVLQSFQLLLLSSVTGEEQLQTTDMDSVYKLFQTC